MVAHNPDIDFYFLFDRAYDPEFIFAANVKPVVLFPQARLTFLWYWWFEISVAGWLKKHKPGLFLSTDGYGCLHTSVPQVLVIHDLAFEHFKGHVPVTSEWYYRYFTPRFARKADRLATVSEFSKKDIAERYGIAPGKIDVVYNGAKEVYQPVSEVQKKAIQLKYAGGSNYFIYVGSIHPRKNIKNLLLAFEQFKKDTGADYKLLVVGRKAWNFDEVEATHAAMQYGNDVKFMGHVPPQELGQITASAFAMVYVSLFEGFGIPIVEAMNCGVPVITSNITSMPEAAGEAALLVNPYKEGEIANAMARLYSDASLRALLIERGAEQVKKFSWDLTAAKLWACCLKVLNNT